MNLLWSYQTVDAIRSAPIISDKSAFTGSDDRNLYALGLKTGKKVWVSANFITL